MGSCLQFHGGEYGQQAVKHGVGTVATINKQIKAIPPNPSQIGTNSGPNIRYMNPWWGVRSYLNNDRCFSLDCQGILQCLERWFSLVVPWKICLRKSI